MDRAADPIEGREWLAFRVQGLATPPGNLQAEFAFELPGLVVFGDRRKANHLPILLSQHMAGEIVPRVTPEGRLSCSRCMITMIAPVLVSLSGCRGCGRTGRSPPVAGFARAPLHVGTTPGQHATDRGGDAAALSGRLKLGCGLPLRREASGKELPVPDAGDDLTAVARQFVGEVLAPGLRSRRTGAFETRG